MSFQGESSQTEDSRAGLRDLTPAANPNDDVPSILQGWNVLTHDGGAHLPHELEALDQIGAQGIEIVE